MHGTCHAHTHTHTYAHTHTHTLIHTCAHAQTTLRNGRAVCFMKMGQWEDAEADLLDAFNKDAKDADTLANLVTVGLHLSKNVARYSS